jgi:hypothetical protein
MSRRVVHLVMKPHPRFPTTRCGRTLDLKRDRRHGVVGEATCPRCLEARK